MWELCAWATRREGATNCHWEGPQRRKRRLPSDAAASTHATVSAAVEALFSSDSRAQLVQASLRKSALDIAKAIRGQIAATERVSMLQVLAISTGVMKAKGQNVRLATADASCSRRTALARDIARFVLSLRKLGLGCKNAAVYAAAAVTIMQRGYYHQGVELVPKLQWVADNAPGDTQYSLVPSVGCRAISIAVRAIKRSLISNACNALIARRFICSPESR